MPNQQDPRMVQWQMRFETASRAASEPRRPNESPEVFQQRQRAAYDRLRQLQTSKPTPGPAPQGQMQRGAPQGAQGQQQPQGGGLYDYIRRKMAGG